MLIKTSALQKALDNLRKSSDMMGSGTVPSGSPRSTKEANGGLQDEIDEDLPDELNTTDSMNKGLPPMPSGEDEDDGFGDEDDDGDQPPMPNKPPLAKGFTQLAKSNDPNVFQIDGWLKNVMKSVAQSNQELVAFQTAQAQVSREQFQSLAKSVVAIGDAVSQIADAVGRLTGQPVAPPQAQFAPTNYQAPQQPLNKGFQQPQHQPNAHQAQQQAPNAGGGQYEPRQILKGLTNLVMSGQIAPEEVSVYETSLQDTGVGTLSQQAQQALQTYFSGQR